MTTGSPHPSSSTMAALAAFGIVGGIFWLMAAKHPIVNLDVFKDRNFCDRMRLISAVGGILYAGSVIIPQFAQTVLGYTATWSGLILSPGGLVDHRPHSDRRRADEVYSDPPPHRHRLFHHGRLVSSIRAMLSPNIDFGTLVSMRTAQTVGLAFLFVPISTVAYLTLPRDLTAMERRCSRCFATSSARSESPFDGDDHRADTGASGAAVKMDDALPSTLQRIDREHAKDADHNGPRRRRRA